ncbi:MAG: hypothetical protein AAFR59_10690, partial [Bacteroidota bacterium]
MKIDYLSLAWSFLLAWIGLGLGACGSQKKTNRPALLQQAFVIHQQTLELYREVRGYHGQFSSEIDPQKMLLEKRNDSIFVAWEEAFTSVPGYENQFPQDTIFQRMDHGLSLMEDMSGEEILALQKQQQVTLRQIQRCYKGLVSNDLHQETSSGLT